MKQNTVVKYFNWKTLKQKFNKYYSDKNRNHENESKEPWTF